MITNDHLLAGPYALDAIDGDELNAFEDHLDDCATCTLEVSGFRETASLLAQAVAQPVPSGLLNRVMAEVRTTPQLPPLPAPSTEVTADTGPRSLPTPPNDVEPEADHGHAEPESDQPDNVVPFRSRILTRTPSIKRMKEAFGFDPKIGIKDALRKSIDFFVEEHKALEKVVETEG